MGTVLTRTGGQASTVKAGAGARTGTGTGIAGISQEAPLQHSDRSGNLLRNHASQGSSPQHSVAGSGNLPAGRGLAHRCGGWKPLF